MLTRNRAHPSFAASACRAVRWRLLWRGPRRVRRTGRGWNRICLDGLEDYASGGFGNEKRKRGVGGVKVGLSSSCSSSRRVQCQ